tara:strand:- start:10376 stop:10570 length:195 start_codon:yes stop_codon:yes gene_type:complete
MKIQATAKFSELGSDNNWAGFGKETYIKLESGGTVEVDSVDESLVEGGYVKEATTKKKSNTKEK